MADSKRLVFDSSAVQERGKGIKFTATFRGQSSPAFIIRFNGQTYAYLNQCAHLNLPLDWLEGEFFDDSGLYLICSSHGALYTPETGACVAGPCRGKCLTKLDVYEQAQKIYVTLESK